MKIIQNMGMAGPYQFRWPLRPFFNIMDVVERSDFVETYGPGDEAVTGIRSKREQPTASPTTGLQGAHSPAEILLPPAPPGIIRIGHPEQRVEPIHCFNRENELCERGEELD